MSCAPFRHLEQQLTSSLVCLEGHWSSNCPNKGDSSNQGGGGGGGGGGNSNYTCYKVRRYSALIDYCRLPELNMTWAQPDSAENVSCFIASRFERTNPDLSFLLPSWTLLERLSRCARPIWLFDWSARWRREGKGRDKGTSSRERSGSWHRSGGFGMSFRSAFGSHVDTRTIPVLLLYEK